ncbi:hypothetical protein PoB_005000300 [Plakobranchus ocellatus]|uniref:Uncharacterized protein n=1 Tax=Plakobranchus ocellatus TaxID=259542 RepID=A0AAV4BV82_9GAST|nr:hypothetical protein PoB_005000300 [Plakobranchus ocellatus]
MRLLKVGCYMYTACQQNGDLRLSGLLPGQGVSGRARTRNRRVPADLRVDSLSTVPPTPPTVEGGKGLLSLMFPKMLL